MSELKVHRFITTDELFPEANAGALYYDKSEADKVIAELKDKIQQKDFFWEGCGFSKMGFKNTIDVANYVEELKAKVDSLQRENQILKQYKLVAHSSYGIGGTKDESQV